MLFRNLLPIYPKIKTFHIIEILFLQEWFLLKKAHKLTKNLSLIRGNFKFSTQSCTKLNFQPRLSKTDVAAFSFQRS
jgi:hypothetical protein